MIREWLMRMIAGPKAYWVSDMLASEFKDFSGTTASNGAALVLAKTMDQIDATKATYEIDGWRVTVEKTST